MENNLFEELQAKKAKLLEMAEKAHEFGWIAKDKNYNNKEQKNTISLQEIKEKLAKDTLTIGVIGQMKCGKSTFLNSFVFENEVLPAATTPMTAALSVITYGEKERIVAEFYTKDEWAEQKMVAQMNEYEASSNLEASKIKAAKELVAQSVNLGASVDNYLGKTKEDSFENLIEYVGAEGKYVSITKSVTIYYPKEYLKGVEIVDTPGFNDPIVSREERTKEFLKKADVVIMMLYAGRPFDATDRDIIFKNVRQCGIGKVIVGINKYDIPYSSEENPETEEDIKNYVKAEIRKASIESNDSTLQNILEDVEPIPLSAEMALLSQLPMSKIQNTDRFDFAYKRHCDNFEISSQRELYEKSHLKDFIDAVKNIVEKEKNRILLVKPLNAIISAGISRMEKAEKDLALKENEISLLNSSDMDIEKKEIELKKAKKEIEKKIEELANRIEYNVKQMIKTKGVSLDDIVKSSCDNMRNIVRNDFGRFSSVAKIIPSFEAEVINMNKKLRIELASISSKTKKDIIDSIESFLDKLRDIIDIYIEDFDAEAFVNKFKDKIDLQLEEQDLFADSNDDNESEYGFFDYIGIGIAKLVNIGTLGILNGAINFATHSDSVRELQEYINSIHRDFDAKKYLNKALERVEEIKNIIYKSFFEEFIDIIFDQLNEVRAKKEDREKNLKEAEEKKKELELLKAKTETELENISSYKALIQ